MTNKLLISGVALLLSYAAIANTTTTEPVFIASGKQQAQLKSNIGIFEENVEIVHGSRKISADRLEVHRREELGENSELLVATGNPARFQEQQSDGSVISASAQEVRYDVANRTLTISGNAEIMQAGQKINADVIVYDMAKQLINAERSSNSKGQVKTILVPEQKDKKQNKEQGKP
ncbi:lipopolysaccharide transport periplasmic protein LptA [Pseudoalteromonas fenneropenaei]|uniref:Lipopolysaccharide transport periplasmic protein LptA n=1 Tax=Pseudoalteromonas fenneropenaei TaxID=1737459 RepID=A0ABV7CKF0_9GAMM